MNAISQPGFTKAVTAMNEDQLRREKLYQASMEMFRQMLENGLITDSQFRVIETKMREKYRPIFGTLYPG